MDVFVCLDLLPHIPSEILRRDSPHFRAAAGDYFTSDQVVGTVPLDSTRRYAHTHCFEQEPIYARDLPMLRQMGVNAVRLWMWDPQVCETRERPHARVEHVEALRISSQWTITQADHTHFLDAAWNNGWSSHRAVLCFNQKFPGVACIYVVIPLPSFASIHVTRKESDHGHGTLLDG